jgi:predicted Zn-dependent protease
VAVIALAGCVGAPSQRPPPVDNDSAPPSKAYGRAFLAEALHTYRFIVDPDVTGPVQRTGTRLVTAIGADPAAIHFFVIDEPQPNAFAIPGGYIFVFTGLLSKLSDDEELAGVLAHELGHVSYNHFFQDRNQILALNLATVAALLLSRGNPAALAFGSGASYHLQLAYSREHEAEADAAAVSFLRKAHYDPSGLARFFKTLEVYERFNPPSVPAYFTTHPGVSERLGVVESMIQATPPRGVESGSIDWGRLRASLGVVPEGPNPSPRDRYLRGINDLKNQRIAAAIEEFRAVLTAEPHHAAARADLAWALLSDQRLDEAHDEARRAQQDDPHLAEPSVALGILAQDAGDHQAAIQEFLTAAADDPYDPTTHLRLASSYAALGDSTREAYHLGRHFRLSLMPARAAAAYQRFLASPDADRETKRAVEQELAMIRREGI